MAKSSRRKESGVALKRRLVAKDEKLLSPTLADFSTIIFSGDMVVQNFFQTVLPEITGPCDCRKPGVALYEQAARELGLDLAASAYVGGFDVCTLPSTSAFLLESCTHDAKSTTTDWLFVVAVRNASSPATKALSVMRPDLNWAAEFIMPG